MSQQFIPLSVPNFSGNEKQYVNEAVISEWVSTGGSKVSEFEEKIAEYTHMPWAVACNSGTSGLHLAMLMAGVGRGDEVLAPALTFIAAVNPIRYAGAEPVFIGCGESLCLCPALAGEWLAANTEQRDGKCVNRHTGAHVKALLAVHVFGNMANMPGLVELCRKYGLVLIEDSTEALGTYYTEGPYRGKMAGTIGDIGVYSFNGHWFYSLYLKDSGLDRDTVIAKLQEQGIQTRPVWALINEQADYPKNEAYALEKAQDYRKYIVNLPCSTNLTEQDCERVIAAVKNL